ncbi:MAG TPA: hypothetical protein VFU57_02765 [Candidatus Acidoferrales bacterium]|nr:hypothetical protein [Candidatus Acidoferrales bacterium]
MSDPHSSGDLPLDKGRRRSMRVMLSVTIMVRGKSRDGKSFFDEETKTLVVNAHGALILLGSEVVANQKITITHKAAQKSETCRIVYVGQQEGDKAQVGIEFDTPAPKFWGISFPPEDWNVTAD